MKRPVRWEAGWRRSLPPEWEVAPLWAHATCNDEVLPETTAAESRFRYVEISDVDEVQGIIGSTDVTFGAAPSRARRKVREGDVILSTVRTYLRAAAAVDSEYAGSVVSTGFAVIRPRTIHAGYLKHVVASDIIIEEVIARSVGVSYPAINATEVMKLKIPVPPLDEQRRIAAFLDHETARIDELVREQEHLAGLLLERRSALVISAVSGRLTGADTVTSRVPWLPTIARGWEEVQIRRVAKLGTGHTPSRSRPEYWEDCTVPWITTGEVAQLRDDRIEYLSETREMISEVGLANSSAVLHPAGTVFLSRTASAGFSGIMGQDMATSQDFVTWTCGPRLRPRFLLLCLRAMRPDLLGRLAMGSTHKTIYMPDVEQLMIPLPSVEEQDEIVERTWKQLRAIDDAVDALRQNVDLLRERRSALITAAVTGQIDHRTWRVDEPAAEVA